MSPAGAALLALALVLLAVYVSWTAGRLDRLHARVDAAWAALDAALVRRAAAARAVVVHLPALAPQTRELDRAVAAALLGGPVAREGVENDLSAALRAALPLLPAQGTGQAREELAAATARVGLARAFHNSAVANARAQRRKRLPRVLHLAGHRAVPRHFDIDTDIEIDIDINIRDRDREVDSDAGAAGPVAGGSAQLDGVVDPPRRTA